VVVVFQICVCNMYSCVFWLESRLEYPDKCSSVVYLLKFQLELFKNIVQNTNACVRRIFVRFI
jgi:hypothetical protein